MPPFCSIGLDMAHFQITLAWLAGVLKARLGHLQYRQIRPAWQAGLLTLRILGFWDGYFLTAS